MGKGTQRLENIFDPSVDEVNQGFTINAWHVSQSVNAFIGTGSYDIDISGSLTVTGSIYHEDAQDAAGVLSNVVVRNNATGEYFITGSYGGGSGSGSSGSSGTSGVAGSSGSSGTSGVAGSSGSSGTSGAAGSSGSSGTSGAGQAVQILDNGTSVTTDVASINFVGTTITNPGENPTITVTGGGGGSSGSSGTSGNSGSSGSSGTSGNSGSSGSSGTSGVAGSSGSSGTSGVAGSSGSSGTSGNSGSSGSSGTSGVAGSSGSSGTSGSSGSSGTSGVAGSSGSSGTSGVAGSSGSSGTSGSSGSSGTAGSSGSSGTSGTTPTSLNGDVYDVQSRATVGPGFSTSVSFVTGTTVITSGNLTTTVRVSEIANLILGNQVHITATPYGKESTFGSKIVSVYIGAGAAILPQTIGANGEITFQINSNAPTEGFNIMYHIIYTTATIPT